MVISKIQLDLPYCLYLEDRAYPFKYRDVDAIIYLKKKSRCATPADLPFNKTGKLQGEGFNPMRCEIVGDRFGRVLFTELTMEVKEDLRGTRNISLKIDLVLKWINRVIIAYRISTDDYWLPTLAAPDLVAIQAKFTEDDGTEQDGFIKLPELVRFTGTNTLFRLYEAHTVFQQCLSREKSFYPHTLVRLNALMHYKFSVYWLAVVEAQTSFEAFFNSYTRWYITTNSVTLPTAERNILSNPRHSLTGDQGKLARLSPHITNPTQTFEPGEPYYDEWYDKGYKLRCEVIHEGNLNISENECKEALNAIKKAIKFFGQDWEAIDFM